MDRSQPKKTNTPETNHTKGFTLVELAVVVAVIALLVGSMLIPLATQVEQRNISQTQKQWKRSKKLSSDMPWSTVGSRGRRPPRTMVRNGRTHAVTHASAPAWFRG